MLLSQRQLSQRQNLGLVLCASARRSSHHGSIILTRLMSTPPASKA